MANATGVHAHATFKLGKAAAKHDSRNLLLAAVMGRLIVPPPPRYDFDDAHPGVPLPMFGNDQYGDCVMAGRAHQTLRFEDVEQGSVPSISDDDVLNEYFKETGGEDSGLVVLDSLKAWRNRGWRVGKTIYKIKAFAQLDLHNHEQLRTAIFLDIGIGLGLQLPISAQSQIENQKPWDVTDSPGSEPGSWGGHYVHVPGYTEQGPVCITWGKKQQMTWAFFNTYCDEAFAILDALDKTNSLIDREKIRDFLREL